MLINISQNQCRQRSSILYLSRLVLSLDNDNQQNKEHYSCCRHNSQHTIFAHAPHTFFHVNWSQYCRVFFFFFFFFFCKDQPYDVKPTIFGLAMCDDMLMMVAAAECLIYCRRASSVGGRLSSSPDFIVRNFCGHNSANDCSVPPDAQTTKAWQDCISSSLTICDFISSANNFRRLRDIFPRHFHNFFLPGQ